MPTEKENDLTENKLINMDINKLMNMDTKSIALKRCKELLKHYLSQKKEADKLCNQAQIVSLFLGAITPVLLILPIDGQSIKIIAAITSAGASVSTSLLSMHGWRETYLRSGYTYHALESEMNRYLTQASDDYINRDKVKAAQSFSKRIEDIYMTEVTDWRSEMQRIEQKRPNNANDQ